MSTRSVIRTAPRLDLRIRAFGAITVGRDGATTEIEGTQLGLVLAVLLLRHLEHPGHSTDLDVFQRTLWERDPQRLERRKNVIQRCVSDLRDQLGRDWDWIRHENGAYRLDVRPGALDLAVFEDLCRDGRDALAAGDPRSARRLLRQGLELANGGRPFGALRYRLPDGDLEYDLEQRTEKLDEMIALAREDRLEAELALGLYRESIAELKRLVAGAPDNERLRELLIRAHGGAGRRKAALRAYDEYVLTSQFAGLAPSRTIADIAEGIRRGDPAPVPASLRAVAVVARDPVGLEVALAVAEPLARRPRREVILAAMAPRGDVTVDGPRVHALAGSLSERGTQARAATPVGDFGRDLLELVKGLGVDHVLVDAASATDDAGVFAPDLSLLLAEAPYDVGLFYAPRASRRPVRQVLVPFAGRDDDWTAAGFAAQIALAWGVEVVVAGPADEAHGDSTVHLELAAIRIAHAPGGPTARSMVVERGHAGIVAAAGATSLVVTGLSPRWRTERLGPTRLGIVRGARSPLLLVRKGPRRTVLAPDETVARLTWSLHDADL